MSFLVALGNSVHENKRAFHKYIKYHGLKKK